MLNLEEHITMTKPKGFLIDLDGTLYFKDKPYPGAIQTVKYLRQKKKRLVLSINNKDKYIDKYNIVRETFVFGEIDII